jgi:ankyrin repeat protein
MTRSSSSTLVRSKRTAKVKPEVNVGVKSAANYVKQHPMCVLPVHTVLALTSLSVHEDLAESLVEWTPCMGKVLFISQTWLSYEHPDPRNEKLRLLQHILRRAKKGRLAVEAHAYAAIKFGDKVRVDASEMKQVEFVWFDIFSVPQRDPEAQKRAVASIVSYVNDSAFFMVLAGPWRHLDDGSVRDVRAWMKRGWCRMEWLANALSPNVKPVLVAQSFTCIESHGPMLFGQRWTTENVGEAVFTVESDRQLLGPVIAHMVLERKRQLDGQAPQPQCAITGGGGSSGNASMHVIRGHEWRMLHALGANLLRGTGCEDLLSSKRISLPEWLKEMHFEDSDVYPDGRTPLFYACVMGSLDFMENLIDCHGADMGLAIKEDCVVFGITAGETPLQTVCTLHDDPALVGCFLQRGVQVSKIQKDGILKDGSAFSRAAINDDDAFQRAAMSGRTKIMDALLKCHPTLLVTPDTMGFTPLASAVYNGQCATFQHLLKNYRAAVEKELHSTDGLGNSLVTAAIHQVGDTETLTAVLEAGADCNQMGEVRTPFAIPIAKFDRLVHSQNKSWRTFLSQLLPPPLRKTSRGWFLREPVADMMAFKTRCSALHKASANGNLLAVEILVEHGACLDSAEHPMRMTALHLAARGGHSAVARFLLEKGCPLEYRDTHGRTASEWARHCGDNDLSKALKPLRK